MSDVVFWLSVVLSGLGGICLGVVLTVALLIVVVILSGVAGRRGPSPPFGVAD